jgi:hypothetical protein
MRWAGKAALTAVFLAGVTTIGFAATKEDSGPAKDTAKTAALSFDSVVGKRLVSIEGSTISVTPSEGGLAREIVAPNGSVQRTFFTFINDRLGTVTDASDVAKVIGVFRTMDAGIEVQYADGSTETLAANAQGGIIIESISAAATSCMAWYPEGHAFSLEERKTALAQYASRLGLGDPADKRLETGKSNCAAMPGTKVTEVRAKPEIAATQTRVPRPLPASAGLAAAARLPALKGSDVAADAHAIDVRNSEVHLIDAPAADAAAAPQVLASAEPPPNPAAAEQRGASTCLSVESDGSHWGFRNHCGYTVQFAYCLMNGAPLASCHDGSISGSVAGNGFGALVADESLKETDAAHDFRWVACQGGAGEVIPRMDQTNPPAGRCVR